MDGGENEEENEGLSQDNLAELQQWLDDFLTNKWYDESQGNQLIEDILSSVMERLHSYKKPYKYITDLMISHRVGANLTNYTAASFDKSLDNIYYIYFPKEKNMGGKDKPLIFALLTICWVSYMTKRKN